MNGFFIKKVENAHDLPLPKFATTGSAGMDLYANILEDVVLKSGDRKLIQTGICVELPDGFEAQIRPRSGLALKNGISVLNSPGTIDSDYRGEIGIILINLSNEDFIIKRGDRIAQMVINKVEMIIFTETDNLSETVRSDGGFGHSGVSEEIEFYESDEQTDDVFKDIANFKENLSISKVIKFFEKRDIYFTKTMIQNYNRINAIPKLFENRYYTRDHLVYLYFINLLKNTFSIEEITIVLDRIYEKNEMISFYQKIMRLHNDLNTTRDDYNKLIDMKSDNLDEKTFLKMLEINCLKNQL